MLLDAIQSGFNPQIVISSILASLVIIFLVLPFHEWAHAFAASLLGDKGIKYRGRLTLNPLSHVDPIGALAILFIGFGWARPVEIDPRYFKNQKVGMGISAAAGPLANLVAAFAGGLLFNAVMLIPMSSQVAIYIIYFFQYFIIINISLAMFNLIPIPPLDGSKILFMFLPDNAIAFFYRYERIFYFALLFLVFTGNLSIVSYATSFVYSLIMNVTSLPFSLF